MRRSVRITLRSIAIVGVLFTIALAIHLYTFASTAQAVSTAAPSWDPTLWEQLGQDGSSLVGNHYQDPLHGIAMNFPPGWSVRMADGTSFDIINAQQGSTTIELYGMHYIGPLESGSIPATAIFSITDSLITRDIASGWGVVSYNMSNAGTVGGIPAQAATIGIQSPYDWQQGDIEREVFFTSGRDFYSIVLTVPIDGANDSAREAAGLLALQQVIGSTSVHH